MAKFQSKHIKMAVGGVLIATVAIGGWRFAQNRMGSLSQVDAIHIDMAKPDVVIQSDSLNQLPSKLLTIPVIKDILTQDVVFYYQEAPAKQSLQGALQRLAFDHNLRFEDRIIDKMLARKGDLYVWKGHTNKPDHWLFVGNSDAFSKFSEVLAKVALDDSQLIQVDTIKVDGNKIPLYALTYQGKTGLFAATAERVVFLSDAGMLMDLKSKPAKELQLEAKIDTDKDGNEKVTPLPMPKAEKPDGKLISERANMVEKLLSKRPENQQTINQGLGLSKAAQHPHSVYFSAAMLTLSYQDFMGGFQGSRFEFDGNTWQQAIALKPSLLPNHEWNGTDLFAHMPHNAAFCANAPIEWNSLNTQAKKLPTTTDALNLAQFNSPVLACWYAGSPAAAPLFVTKLPKTEQREAQLAALQQVFSDVIGAKEYTHKQRFEVSRKETQGVVVNERIVSARYGSHDTDDLPATTAKELSATSYFPVRYAVSGDYVWFSPNGDLVEQAVAVSQQQAPALAEQMQQQNSALLWVNGAELAKWLQQQTSAVIAEDSDMRTVLSQRLTPKLRLISSSGSWQVQADTKSLNPSSNNTQWVNVTWQHTP